MREDRERLQDMLVHEYFRIDPQILWDITQYDLPALQQTLQTMQQDLDI